MCCPHEIGKRKDLQFSVVKGIKQSTKKTIMSGFIQYPPCCILNPSWKSLQLLFVFTAPPLPKKSSGYLMISANGGLNQQRIAVYSSILQFSSIMLYTEALVLA
jgi:hypothetical protein